MAKVKAEKELYFDTTDGNYYVLNPDGTYDQATVDGAALVNLFGAGPNTYARVVPLVAVTGWQEIHYAAGSDITYLEVKVVGDQFDYTVTGTAAALGTTGVVSNYADGTLVISGLTGETINLTGLIGSAQTLETAAIRVIDLNTGAVAAASALGNGSYKLVDLAVHKLKFTKSAAVENATVTLTLSDRDHGNIAAVVVVDFDGDDTARDALFGATGDVPAGIEYNGLDFCHLGDTIQIPVFDALSKGDYSGGRVDVRSLDGSPIMVLVKAK